MRPAVARARDERDRHPAAPRGRSADEGAARHDVSGRIHPPGLFDDRQGDLIVGHGDGDIGGAVDAGLLENQRRARIAFDDVQAAGRAALDRRPVGFDYGVGDAARDDGVDRRPAAQAKADDDDVARLSIAAGGSAALRPGVRRGGRRGILCRFRILCHL